MSSHPQSVTVSAFADFKCHSCTLCCRSAWQVQLTSYDYEIIKTIVTHKYGAKNLSQYVTLQATPQNQEVAVVATLNKRKNFRCVFLNDKTGFCDIQTEFGHEALPVTCKTFPRVRFKNGTENTHLLSLSCPSVQKLLYDKKTIKLHDISQDFDTHYPVLVSSSENDGFKNAGVNFSSQHYQEFKKVLIENTNSISGFTNTVFGAREWLRKKWNEGCAIDLNDYQNTFSTPSNIFLAITDWSLLADWLKIRCGFGPLEPPALNKFVKEFSWQNYVWDKEELNHLEHNHQHILVQYFASRFLFDPFALELNNPVLLFDFAELFFLFFLFALDSRGVPRLQLQAKDIEEVLAQTDTNIAHAGPSVREFALKQS